MPRAATATLSALVALAALASASAPPADPAPGPAWHWPLGASYAVRDFDLGPPPVPDRAWDAAPPSGFLGVPPEALERTGLTRVLVFGQGDLPDFGAGQHAAHRHAVS